MEQIDDKILKVREISRRYYYAHRDEINARKREQRRIDRENGTRPPPRPDRQEYQKEYRERPDVKERQKEYRQRPEVKERQKVRIQRYYEAHKEEINKRAVENTRARLERDTDAKARVRASQRAYTEEHKEYYRNYMREYNKKQSKLRWEARLRIYQTELETCQKEKRQTELRRLIAKAQAKLKALEEE